MRRHPRYFLRRVSGFSLVELMVAITIGLLVMAAIVTVMVSSKKNYTVQDSLARLQENARFAVDFIARDLRMAGYYGCADDVSAVQNNVDTDGAPLLDTTLPLEAVEDMVVGTSTWYPSSAITDDLTGAKIKIVPGTDAITVRFMDGAGTPVTPPYMPTTAAALHVEPGNKLNKGDVVMVADCQSADVFQVTSVNPDLNGTVGHNDGAAGVSPGNAVKDLSKIYEDGAFIGKLTAARYFVATNIDRPNRPGLYRVTGAGAAQELVEGVEHMQILYGEVTDGNRARAPNVYVTADKVAVWSNVVSVRIGLLLYSLAGENTSGEYGTVEDVGPYNVNGKIVSVGDGNLDTKRVKRRVFTTTVSLRNIR